MDGDLIYAFSDSLAFTYVFNVSNPTEPVLVSRFSPNEITEDFEIQYDILGVGQDIIYFSATVYDDSVVVNDDIHIFDSADLDNIQFVSCYNPEDIVVGKPFIIKESVALVNVIRANSETGIGVLDLTDPADPILVGFSESLFSIEKTKFVDETAIVAGNGIGIYNCSEAINFNFPPAFTDAPPESLMVPEVGVEVSLDITGRDRKGEAVSFSVIWDGNDPGVSFSDKEDGTAEFRWTPEEEDEGLHTAHFIISDGALTDTATTVLVVGNVQSVEPDPTHPSSMSLLEVYPNPFNSMTTIHYTTPNTSEVKLTIYDVVGRQIADLFVGTVESGGHSFVFDGSGFESGVYVVRMTNGGNDKYEKILLVK